MRQVKSVTGNIITYASKHDESTVAQVDQCPLSLDKGKKMKRKTLTNHLHPEYWHYLSHDHAFYYCPDSQCPIIYFNNEDQWYFTADEVKTQVMHKIPISTPNRIACYCMGVLERTILDELLVKQCCDSLKDIQAFTKANTGKDCAITNPTGRCCGSEIKKIIDWAKNERKTIASPVLEEAVSCCKNIEDNTLLRPNDLHLNV